MAIFKPESSGNMNDYLGICEFGMIEFTDKSGEFDWADLFIEVTVKQKGSDYDRNIQIKGSYEKEGGKITGGSALKRLYQFFDAIGCTAGVNVKGGWEDESGDEIKDIAGYLNDNHLSSVIPGTNPKFDYLAYFYREQPKVPGGKSYTRAWNKVYKNEAGNKAKLQSDVNWMKSKGYLKEVSDEVINKAEMSGSAMSNL
jgi:hypothetical protein